MAKAGKKPELTPERIAEIAADARSGKRWGESDPPSPACICGSGQRLYDTARGFRGTYGVPTPDCPRHEGGTVWAPPAGLWESIKNPKKESDD